MADRPRARRPDDQNRGRPRRDGGRPPFNRPRPEGDRPSFDRPRQEGDRPPFNRPRREGDRPPFDRPRREGDRPPFERPRRDFSRPAFDRPRPAGERPQSDRPQSDRAPFDRPRREGQRPPFERPRRDFSRPGFDRPRRDDDRPRRDDDRPPRDDDRPVFDRPPDRPAFDRPAFERPAFERPAFERPRREGERPPFDRPRGPGPGGTRPGGGRPGGSRPWSPREQRGQPRPFSSGPVRALSADAQSLGEDEELICGRRPVEEAFAARRAAIRVLVVPERRAALDQLVIHATTLRIPVVEVEGGTLTALAGFDGHQGIALVAKPRPIADVETILAAAQRRGEPPFVLILDSLEDPQNFGTLLRSAEAVGVHGVVYPTRRAAPLSPAAIKAAAGATEHLLLAAVDDLPGALVDLHGRGVRLVAAEENAPLTYTDADLRGPLALVVGSEGKGISGPIRRRLDLSVRIPMRGKVGSLNAAVAGSVLLFAAAQQRPEPAPKEAPPTDSPPPEQSVEVAPEASGEQATEEPPTEPVEKPKRASRRKKAIAGEESPEQSAPEASKEEGGELLPADD